MGLGESAYTTASHVVLFLITLGLIVRLTWHLNGDVVKFAVDRCGFIPALAICAISIDIERLYYICARLLQGRGLNLWSLHPAPEVLSLIMAIGVYAIHISLTQADHALKRLPRRRFWVRSSVEVFGSGLAWLWVAGWLY